MAATCLHASAGSGLNTEQTLVVKGPGIKDSTYQQYLSYFKHEVARLPVVQHVAVSSSVPGRELSWTREFYQPARAEDGQGVNVIAID